MSITTTNLVVRRGSFRMGPISLDLSQGVCGLAGANGAGKSTLIKSLVGALRPTSGSVHLNGNDPWAKASREQAMAMLGYVPQDATLPRWFTVGEALSYAAWLKGVSLRDCESRALRAAEAVGLADKFTVRCGRLSGGMQRRACIAQALVHDPSVLILDEPTVGLDPVQRQNLHHTLEAIGKSRTVLLSTHLADDLARVCDDLVVMNAGEVVFTGDVETVCRGRTSRHDAIDDLLSGLMGGDS